MKRSHFLGLVGTGIAMSSLAGLRQFSNGLKPSSKMPVLFIGHGSPMNGIEENTFSLNWKKIADEMERPQAVLCVSAHWLTTGTKVTAMDFPRTIHDFGGFPEELFAVQYPAPGNPAIAEETKNLITSTDVTLDHEWGLDHGTWTVVRHMYPDSDIPVLQLSIDYYKPASYHYALAQELAALRSKGVLIIGSGNVVHNLRMIDWKHLDEMTGFDWTLDIDKKVKEHILNRAHQPLIDYQTFHEEIAKAIPTPDHYYPLIYALGVAQSDTQIDVFNEYPVAGSLTMTSYKFSS